MENDDINHKISEGTTKYESELICFEKMLLFEKSTF